MARDHLTIEQLAKRGDANRKPICHYEADAGEYVRGRYRTVTRDEFESRGLRTP